MNPIKLGFCICGSFCTFKENIELMQRLVEAGFDIIPILSFNSATMDTRFGKASDHIANIESICNKTVIATIEHAEPIGPKRMTDVILVSPCTGNTLAKLANGITDSPVTMAVKSHLRNGLPVVIAVSTNDALSGSANNIATLLNRRQYYFVPFGQDNFAAKPTSLVSHFELVPQTIELALEGKQLQPILHVK